MTELIVSLGKSFVRYHVSKSSYAPMAQVPSKGTLQLMEFRVHRLWKANDPGTKACTTILGHLYVNSGGFIAILREDLFDHRFLCGAALCSP